MSKLVTSEESESWNRYKEQKYDIRELDIKLTTTYAYNIHKIKDKEQRTKFIFIVARHSQPPLQMFLLISSIRTWNIERLKTQHQVGGI